MTVQDTLAELVAFPTVCKTPNEDLIVFVEEQLEPLGFRITKFPGEVGRLSLLASIGPETDDGVVFSAHSDVVPVEGQPWTSDPFQLKSVDGKLVARGTSDMKGFLACMLEAAKHAAKHVEQLKRPIHLAVSYDEEIGCVGVRSLLAHLQSQGFKAGGCIIGEPTEMEQIIGHKGKLAVEVQCTGLSAHSSNPARGCNAVLLACDLVQEVQALQADLTVSLLDDRYEVPHSTAQVGVFRGGVALNIVPDRCDFQFEMRLLAGSDAAGYVERIRTRAAQLVQEKYPQGTVSVTELNGYPGLDTPETSAFAQSLTKQFVRRGTKRINYGTEGGLFQEYLGLPVVVCGPGSIDRAHKADEWVLPTELDESVAFLNSVIDQCLA